MTLWSSRRHAMAVHWPWLPCLPRLRRLGTAFPGQVSDVDHAPEPTETFGPTWSPDGRQITFGRFESEPTPDTDLLTMRWDGKKPEQVSQSEQFEFSPAWGVGRS